MGDGERERETFVLLASQCDCHFRTDRPIDRLEDGKGPKGASPAVYPIISPQEGRAACGRVESWNGLDCRGNGCPSLLYTFAAAENGKFPAKKTQGRIYIWGRYDLAPDGIHISMPPRAMHTLCGRSTHPRSLASTIGGFTFIVKLALDCVGHLAHAHFLRIARCSGFVSTLVRSLTLWRRSLIIFLARQIGIIPIIFNDPSSLARAFRENNSIIECVEVVMEIVCSYS